MAKLLPGRHFLRVGCRPSDVGQFCPIRPPRLLQFRIAGVTARRMLPVYYIHGKVAGCATYALTVEKMMGFIRFIAFTAALLGPLSAAPAVDKISQVFIRDAIQTNLAEIQLGQLAQDKAEGSDVKSYAQTLVNDQSALNEQAQKVATQIGITVPTKPSVAQKTAYDSMSKLSGAAFDRAFIKNTITDQEMNIARFENEAKKKNDPVADYAGQALATLKQHLDAARNLAPGI